LISGVMTGVTAGAIIGFIGAAADFTAGLLAAFRLAGFFFPAFFFAAFFLDFLAAFLAGFRFFADFFFEAFFFVDFRFVLRFFAFLAFFAVFFFAAFFFVAMVKLLFQCWTEWRLVPTGTATAATKRSDSHRTRSLVALDRYIARFVEAFSTRTSLVKWILDASRDVKRDYLSGLAAFWCRVDTNQGYIARSSVRSEA
jgi:hypothetical protein